MIKWIKNSKASKTNKSSKYKGIRTTNNIKKYETSISISKFTFGKRDKEKLDKSTQLSHIKPNSF